MNIQKPMLASQIKNMSELRFDNDQPEPHAPMQDVPPSPPTEAQQ